VTTPHLDYVFDRLDHTDGSEAARARQQGWLQAVQRGFHQGGPNEDYEKVWRAHVAADAVECRGAWLPEGVFGASEVPVATLAWFDKTLSCGREQLPLRMITDVTTRPTHRRRGLVRRLMEDCLDDAVASGVALAALTVSEATIYGRWGFGAATFYQQIELDTGPRFGLRDFTDPGRVELVEPADSWPLVRHQLEAFQQRSRGMVGVPQFYEPLLTARWSFSEKGPDTQLRTAVHLTTPDGPGGTEQVDGVAVYRFDGRDGDKRKVKLLLLLAEDPAAQLALWEYVGGIDLVNHVTYDAFEPTDPLPWALRDLHALTLSARVEFLWVRVLDVPRALAARSWAADGEVVLEVDDAQGHAAGRWQVTVSDGVASVETTDAPAEVTLDAETLGTLYLGPVGVTTLQRAGRLHGTDEHVRRLAAMADLPDQPYNILGF
jgi:predicted acetyltransferase